MHAESAVLKELPDKKKTLSNEANVPYPTRSERGNRIVALRFRGSDAPLGMDTDMGSL